MAGNEGRKDKREPTDRPKHLRRDVDSGRSLEAADESKYERAVRLLDGEAQRLGHGRVRDTPPLRKAIGALWARQREHAAPLSRLEIEPIIKAWSQVAEHEYQLDWSEFLDVGGADEDDACAIFAMLCHSLGVTLL